VKPYATLISFGEGEIFARYLKAMFASAERRFFPGRAQLLELPTTPGWPYACRDRHTHILRHRRKIRGQFILMLDADLLFEGTVADEIVADGITAVLHPVQNDLSVEDMTYERNPLSPAYVAEHEGSRYYLGGIVGGTRDAFLDLSRQIDAMCRADGPACPVWQDESYVNRILIDQPPALELDQRYGAWFNHTVRDTRIRALNKTDAEFTWRNKQTTIREEALAP
jgi:hypothetical protein